MSLTANYLRMHPEIAERIMQAYENKIDDEVKQESQTAAELSAANDSSIWDAEIESSTITWA